MNEPPRKKQRLSADASLIANNVQVLRGVKVFLGFMFLFIIRYVRV